MLFGGSKEKIHGLPPQQMISDSKKPLSFKSPKEEILPLFTIHTAAFSLLHTLLIENQ
jgi:hypothetical protein